MALTLKELQKKYPSDKPEIIMDFYERYFSPIRLEVRSILELGVRAGDSLKIWHEYFPFARVIGLDIEKVEGFDAFPRIRCYQGSQDDLEIINKIAGGTVFDIIIDDAAHKGQLSVKSLEFLFPQLKAGGIYAIEDWGCGYWRNYGGSKYEGIEYCDSMVGIIKGLVDEVGIEDILNAYGTPSFGRNRESQIRTLEIGHGIAIAVKRTYEGWR